MIVNQINVVIFCQKCISFGFKDNSAVHSHIILQLIDSSQLRNWKLESLKVSILVRIKFFYIVVNALTNNHGRTIT